MSLVLTEKCDPFLFVAPNSSGKGNADSDTASKSDGKQVKVLEEELVLDSQQAVFFHTSEMPTQRLKHMSIRAQRVQDRYKQGLKVKYDKGPLNKSDGLTKSLGREKHRIFLNYMKLSELSTFLPQTLIPVKTKTAEPAGSSTSL